MNAFFFGGERGIGGPLFSALSPTSYMGVFKEALDSSLYTEVEKDEFEISCKFCW